MPDAPWSQSGSRQKAGPVSFPVASPSLKSQDRRAGMRVSAPLGSKTEHTNGGQTTCIRAL